jgi:hypothetical protein
MAIDPTVSSFGRGPADRRERDRAALTPPATLRIPLPPEHGHAQLGAWLVGGALAGKSVDSCTERAQRGA